MEERPYKIIVFHHITNKLYDAGNVRPTRDSDIIWASPVSLNNVVINNDEVLISYYETDDPSEENIKRIVNFFSKQDTPYYLYVSKDAVGEEQFDHNVCYMAVKSSINNKVELAEMYLLNTNNKEIISGKTPFNRMRLISDLAHLYVIKVHECFNTKESFAFPVMVTKEPQ